MVAPTAYLDVSLKNISLLQEGTYKSALEVSSQAERLDFEADGAGFREDSDGKIMTREWQVDSGGDVINCNDDSGKLIIHLDKSSLSSSVYLHATVLKFGEKQSHSNDDDGGYEAVCHGKALLYPRKRLFDPNQSLVQSEHKVKLKLASLLKHEMLQVVRGWMEFSVAVNIDVRPNIGHLSTVEEENLSISEPIREETEESIEKHDQDQIRSPKAHSKLPQVTKENEDIRTDSPLVGIGIEKSYFNLPDIDAVRDILPKYHELTSKQQQQISHDRKSSVQSHVPIQEPDQSEFDDLFEANQKPNKETHTRGGVNDILVYQAQELEKYRTIVETMGKDINLLHKQVAHLKHDKSQLSYQLTLASSEQIPIQDENTVVAQLRHQMVSQNTDKLELQERVTNLQNQMIEKNEVEENYLKLQTAHQEQQQLIHDYQNKMVKLKRLEQLVSEQENVIQVMEKKLKKTVESPVTQTNAGKTNRNTPSRKSDPSIAKVTESIGKIDTALGVIHDLDDAYSTIKALREQIEVNAREIGHERAYMTNRPLYHYASMPKSYPVLPTEGPNLPVTLPAYWRPGDEPTSYHNFAKYSYNHPLGRNIHRKNHPF